MGHVEREYSSHRGPNQNMVITLVKKENNDLFLRNSAGGILVIDSDIELFTARIIPLIALQGIIEETQNQVLNGRNYRFPGSIRSYVTEDPKTGKLIFSPNPP